MHYVLRTCTLRGGTTNHTKKYSKKLKSAICLYARFTPHGVEGCDSASADEIKNRKERSDAICLESRTFGVLYDIRTKHNVKKQVGRRYRLDWLSKPSM